MNISPRLKPTLRLLALAGLLGAPIAALAVPMVLLTANESLGTIVQPGANVMDGNANGGDFFRSGSDGAGNSSFFHTYGFTSGATYFGARASGSGTFFVNSSASYSDSYFNNTGFAQLLTFSYTVDSGQIAVSGTGIGHSDLQLSLRFNGTLVAGDHGRIDSTATGTTCDVNVGGASGNAGDLASYLSCSGGSGTASSAFANSSSYMYSQLVGVNESLSIDYQIVAEASGTYTGGGDTYCSGGDLEGDGLVALAVGRAAANGAQGPGSSGCQFFNAMARSGDPAGFNPFASINPPQITLTQQAVPEPGTLALAALALGGLAFLRRRR